MKRLLLLLLVLPSPAIAQRKVTLMSDEALEAIRDEVSGAAELDPVSIEAVNEYLGLLARAGVVRFRE